MPMVEFEWDSNKAERNEHLHGVSFEQGAVAITDPFAVEWLDEREDYGEERVNLVGMCRGILLHVTYTERGARTRLISSARRKT